MKTLIITTFSPELKYKCNMEKCSGCCRIFNDISVDLDEIARFEELGYHDFYEKRDGEFFLMEPCPFLEGKFCKIHQDKGYNSKFSVCKKYPFFLTRLDSGDVLVDIKWTCPGVGFEEGDFLTEDFLKENVLIDNIQKGQAILGMANLNEKIGTTISFRDMVKLYDDIGDFLIKLELPFLDKIIVFAFLIRDLTLKMDEKRIMDYGQARGILEDFLSRLYRDTETFVHNNRKSLFTGDNFNDFDPFDEIILGGFTSQEAAKNLGIDVKIDMEKPSEELLRDGNIDEKMMTHYLVQSFRETLSKPWDLTHRFFWSLGVIGFVHILSRRMNFYDKDGNDTRTAIRVVDYLNKHFEKFRDYAFPLYPPAGVYYLQLVIERK